SAEGARAKDAEDGVPAEQTVAAQGGRESRLHRLHDRRPLRRRVRPGLRGEVPKPAVHCDSAAVRAADGEVGGRHEGSGFEGLGGFWMVRVFEIITEADARRIERGTTVELAKGGHVTPLAADTLRDRRVTVVPAGSVDPAIPADLAPTADVR